MHEVTLSTLCYDREPNGRTFWAMREVQLPWQATKGDRIILHDNDNIVATVESRTYRSGLSEGPPRVVLQCSCHDIGTPQDAERHGWRLVPYEAGFAQGCE